MTQPIRRVLIQEKLANGRLPRTQIARIWNGPGTHPAMFKGLLRGLTLAAFAVLGTMTYAASAGAATPISSCMILDTFGATYVLTADLPQIPCGDCLVVANDRITIDLARKTITGSCGGVGDGVTDGGTSWQGTTVKNGAITGFAVGVALGASTRNQILNLTSSANSAGIIVGARSLVKGCTIEGNRGNGIAIAEFSQVQGCTIGGADADKGNGGVGIIGGVGSLDAGHLLITNNTVVNNLSGIAVGGDFNTVSFNTSNGNTLYGVFAPGKRSLITGNTTNGNGPPGIAISGLSSAPDNISNQNGGVGLQTSCPSTVTNNKSSGNGSMDYNIGLDIIGTGCQINNNK